MKKIKPESPKFVRELYFNPIVAFAFAVLFLLRMFKVNIFNLNDRLNIVYGGFVLLLMIIFIVRSILNLFYNIQISEDIITFNTPFNLHRKRIAFSNIDDVRFRTNKHNDDTLVVFTRTGEVLSIGVVRYSKEQKKYLEDIMLEKSIK